MRSSGTYPAPRFRDPNDLRLVQIIRASERKMPGAVNLLGVPFDGAILGRKGAADGPSAIRNAMSGFSNFNVELGVGLERARIFDLGDLIVNPSEVLTAHKEI